MNFNSSGYLAYKKSKVQSSINEEKKPISRLNFLFQLFVATFLIMFILIVVTIMKYSSKVDIEYTKGELQLVNGAVNNIAGYSNQIEEDQQRKIDKRLILIQQEENAPSEARIINKPKSQPAVIDASHIEKNKKIDKIEKQKKLNKESEAKSSKISSLIDEVKSQKKIFVEEAESTSNVVIMSKVLIGRYSTFEEAQKNQRDLRHKYPTLQPFVKKIGNAFSIQMGSYQDFATAKKQAQTFSSKGYNVWIYQQ